MSKPCRPPAPWPSASSAAPGCALLLPGDEGEAAVVDDEDVAVVGDGDRLRGTVDRSDFEPVLCPGGCGPDSPLSADTDHSIVIRGGAEPGKEGSIRPRAECGGPVGADQHTFRGGCHHSSRCVDSERHGVDGCPGGPPRDTPVGAGERLVGVSYYAPLGY